MAKKDFGSAFDTMLNPTSKKQTKIDTEETTAYKLVLSKSTYDTIKALATVSGITVKDLMIEALEDYLNAPKNKEDLTKAKELKSYLK